MSDVIVIFGEGFTEVFFYKKLLACLRLVSQNSNVDICVENVKGIGNFISYPYNRMKNEIIPQYKGRTFEIFLCYDTDVYEYQSKPTFDWNKVAKELRKLRIAHVTQIQQIKSIEDWFLKDRESLLFYLGLDANTRIPQKKGLIAMEELYRKAERNYVHGNKVESNRLVNALNMNKLVVELWDDIQPLLSHFGPIEKTEFISSG